MLSVKHGTSAMANNVRQLILGSQSARRRELLEMTGIKFMIMVSDEPEDESPLDLTGVELAGDTDRGTGVVPKVANIAARKALAVKKRCLAEGMKNCVILGADTVVALGSELIGKPRDLDDAKRILTRLSGTTHQVVTAYVICESDTDRMLIRPTISDVTFRPLHEWEIDEYVHGSEVLDKAGAYGIQEKAALFVDRIDGNFHNIVGLPVVHLREDLGKFGITL